MSEETAADQIESSDNGESNVVGYSTRLVERTIERALGLYLSIRLLNKFLLFLDIIYEQSNDKDPKIHEWRHSVDKINIPSN